LRHGGLLEVAEKLTILKSIIVQNCAFCKKHSFKNVPRGSKQVSWKLQSNLFNNKTCSNYN